MPKSGSFPVAIALVLGLAQCTAPDTGTGPTAAMRLVADDLPVSADAGQIVNALRAQHGLPALRSNPTLQRVATAHMRDMAANDFVGHVSTNGDGLRKRGRRQGYRACWIGENVASGQRSAREVVQDWRDSPSHNRIMLHRRAVEYGLVRGSSNIWVLVVAQPGCR